ncbi:lipoprotein [Nocardioides psychrotolerans]|uniref:Putative peptidoglycan binding domain-containing protein n=1 Tax=Nocardioides psychrotolerans TaxID=1005945 RepID=A0A1I3I398_9ACTN|nr:L,D-transpeptidase family protein [Nocardioides psychrotolerans]GEP38620.1 lipoprotein [Nocardioides psychrotolerans]SFI42436.1 Putative peptidoglycan binding domain-containing protein [Nocardioides psychrotolerans]
MSLVRRLTLIVVVAALLSGAAYGVAWATHRWSDSSAPTPAVTAPIVPVEPTEPTGPTEPTEPVEPTPEPELQPGPALLSPGDESDEVRDLQARLRQIDWFGADVTGFYGDLTTEAVRGFQAKREVPVTGEVDRRTIDRLLGMTSEPIEAELTNQLGGNVPGALDPRCLTGRALCVDKTSSTLRWVVDGEVLRTADTRFGGSATPTREGTFSVQSKSRDHVSSLFDTSMPFAMFFSGGQAVHYSPDFAAVGYAGASHGCVNVRDYDAIAWLYDQVEVGDVVIVYRS